MRKKLSVVLLVLGLCVPSVYAQPGNEEGGRFSGMRFEGHREGRIKKMFEQLNLSEEQKKLLEANRAKNKEANKALKEQIRANMKALGEELKKPELDMAKVNALHENGKQLFGKAADQKFNSILEVRKILTKEQFVQFTGMMEKRIMNRPFFKEAD